MKILIAEDDPATQRILEGALTRWGYDVVATSDGERAWEVLRGEDAPKLAILDWMMPGMDGVELCRRVRGMAGEPYVYLILLTVLGGDDDLVSGMEAGADDYITKPFSPEELRVRVRAGQRIVELQSKLMETALRDPLTGLYTRRYLQEFAEKLVAGSARRGKSIALVLHDLDHFKEVNDAHGHEAGDIVLREVARVIGSSVRAADIVIRFGGEEFLVVLLDVDEGDAVRVAEKVRGRVAAAAVELRDGIARVTISAGVSEFPADAADLRRCIQLADAALYRAKQGGRNRTVRYTASKCGQ